MAVPDPTPVNPLETLLGYRIRRVSSMLMASLATELARFGLRPSDASVLVLLGANPCMTQSEVGRHLGIHRANMAPLIASLEKRDLVARERVDGRSHGLVLTVEGDRVASDVRQVMSDHETQIMHAVSQSEVPDFEVVLATIERAFRTKEATDD
jgi:DNA-binding MarR family transcriptional regulator